MLGLVRIDAEAKVDPVVDRFKGLDIIMTTMVGASNGPRACVLLLLGRSGLVVEVKGHCGPTTPCALAVSLKGRRRGILGIVLTPLTIKQVQRRDVFFLRILALALEDRDGLEHGGREWEGFGVRVGARVEWRRADGD